MVVACIKCPFEEWMFWVQQQANSQCFEGNVTSMLTGGLVRPLWYHSVLHCMQKWCTVKTSVFCHLNIQFKQLVSNYSFLLPNSFGYTLCASCLFVCMWVFCRGRFLCCCSLVATEKLQDKCTLSHWNFDWKLYFNNCVLGLQGRATAWARSRLVL